MNDNNGSGPAGKLDLLVIVGPTGAGKTDLAHAVALAREGEIVSADAFAVYRGLDVGTAKPTPFQRSEVRYHMLDVAGPEEPFSAGRFASEARPIVDDVAGRGFMIVARGDVVMSPADQAFWQSLGGSIVRLGTGGEAIEDREGIYTRLMDGYGCDVLVKRPDYDLFGACRMAELPAMLADLRAQLTAG